MEGGWSQSSIGKCPIGVFTVKDAYSHCFTYFHRAASGGSKTRGRGPSNSYDRSRTRRQRPDDEQLDVENIGSGRRRVSEEQDHFSLTLEV